jgi:hypothetical protein
VRYYQSMDLDKLKEAVERGYGKRIVDRPDCEDLSVEIYKKTKLLISYNTIRRFFGLAGQKDNSTVSKSTLNVLAIYCGFQSYFDFCAQLESIDNLGKLYKLQLEIAQQKTLEIAKVEAILAQLEKNEHLYSLMNYITVVSFNRGDVSFLKQLFKIERIFNGEDYLHSHLYFLIQTIGVQVQNNLELAKELWEIWSKDPKARFYYFELFVDMTTLVQAHYIGIQYYLIHSTHKQDIVFANALLAWRFLMLNDTVNARKQLENLDQTIDIKTIHPIPVARLMNCKFVLNFKENAQVSEELLEELATLQLYFQNNTHPFFEHFICEGLLISKCYQIALKYIQEATERTQSFQSFYLNGSTERLKILEAYCLFQIGEKKRSNHLKEQIKLESLDSFSKDYDSVFFHAIDKTTCSKKTIQHIESLGYSHLFELI